MSMGWLMSLEQARAEARGEVGAEGDRRVQGNVQERIEPKTCGYSGLDRTIE